MANVEISGLPLASDLTGDEITVVVQAGVTKRAPLVTSTLFPNVALKITELSTGVWSGDVPERALGVNPLEAVGWSDPLGANGVATPANWQEEHDVWTVKTAP